MPRGGDGLLAHPSQQFEATDRTEGCRNPIQTGGIGCAQDGVGKRVYRPEELRALSEGGKPRSECVIALRSRMTDYERNAARLRGQPGDTFRDRIGGRQPKDYSLAWPVTEHVALRAQASG